MKEEVDALLKELAWTQSLVSMAEFLKTEARRQTEDLHTLARTAHRAVTCRSIEPREPKALRITLNPAKNELTGLPEAIRAEADRHRTAGNTGVAKSLTAVANEIERQLLTSVKKPMRSDTESGKKPTRALRSR